MGRAIRQVCLVALVGVACAACGVRRVDAGGSLAPGDHEISLRHGGRERVAIVHVPQRNHGMVRPLVIAFHGGGGEASGFKAYAGLDAVADREGFVVVYPYGTGRLPRRLLTFNAGDDCCGYARDNNVDDVGFAIALIDEVARRVSIDARRVYATGHSNGGVMSHRLAAERADRIAAIAPVAGALNLEAFAPAVPVPVLHIHSVDDPRALYNGGLGPPFPMTTRRVMHTPVADGLARWADRNGCTDETRVREERVGDDAMSRGHTATLVEWVGCTGAPLEHWRLEGVGHAWPGTTERRNEELVGPPTTVINAAEEAWRFFQRFER